VYLPLHIFEAQPPFGKRITILNLQQQGDSNKLNLEITGHSYPFRARLDAFGIAGDYVDNASGEGRRYHRFWKDIDVEGEGEGRFLDMLSTVFRNAALRITLNFTPEPETRVAAFIEKLRDIPSLFFAPLPDAAPALLPRGCAC